MAKLWNPIKNLFTEENSPSIELKLISTELIAIDQTGSPGSLYDICQDSITGKLDANLKSQWFILQEPIICKLYRGRTPETQNLLQMVGIDQPLRLGILLKMTQPTGIAAIINYLRSIDKYTRFLYFRHESRMESCSDNLIKRIKSRKLPLSETSTAHIITDIVWGTHAVVILQLPPEQHVEIDHLLEQIQHNLIHDDYHVEMTAKEKDLLGQIISTTVYSNIHPLTVMTEIYDIWQRILKMRREFNEHRRLKYILRHIRLLYPEQNGTNVKSLALDQLQIEPIENILLRQFSEMRVLQLRLDQELPEMLQGKLEERLVIARQSFSEIKKLYENNVEQIRNLMISLRKEQDVLASINEVLNSDIQGTINDSLHRFGLSLDKLAAKGQLIKQLQNEGFQYINVTQLGIDQNCNEQLTKDILFKNDTNKIIFCSSDSLKELVEKQWDLLYSEIINERQKNPQLNLIYADFTYCTWPLRKMEILLPHEQKIYRRESNSKLPSGQMKRKTPSPPPLPLSDEYINILLLGESGVGKSTFINAFANYLQCDTLQQAQAGQPIVIIPVSFLITINDNFDEELVKFGEIDSNEDHSKSGQSVTQQCRSYVFNISQGKKLRFIDTPGFGDTRGDNQDEINMNVIFSFIQNLTHLNGTCLLLKPNVGQLNPFLYSCFTQLFEYFGENIRDHLMFCFTNARSTFFAPGDTRPLLTSFFDSFPVKKIPFERKNIFCFDSESFRYLVALQKAIEFNEDDKEEFEKSWVRSVEESKRFRDFLCDELHPYRKNIEWQSIREVQFQINLMIRPMLEGMRNILRNILLHDINSMMELRATYVDQPTMICYKCDRNMMVFGHYWILLDRLHLSRNTVSFKTRNILIERNLSLIKKIVKRYYTDKIKLL